MQGRVIKTTLPDESDGVRFISTKAHSMLDYTSSVTLAAMPHVLGNSSGMRMWIPTALAASTAAYSLLTDYEGGMVPLLSIRTHLMLDVISGALLMVSPILLARSSSSSNDGGSEGTSAVRARNPSAAKGRSGKTQRSSEKQQPTSGLLSWLPYVALGAMEIAVALLTNPRSLSTKEDPYHGRLIDPNEATIRVRRMSEAEYTRGLL